MQPLCEARCHLDDVAQRLETAAALLHTVGLAHSDLAELLALETEICHLAMRVRARRFTDPSGNLDLASALYRILRAACYVELRIPGTPPYELQLVGQAIFSILMDSVSRPVAAAGRPS